MSSRWSRSRPILATLVVFATACGSGTPTAEPVAVDGTTSSTTTLATSTPPDETPTSQLLVVTTTEPPDASTDTGWSARSVDEGDWAAATAAVASHEGAFLLVGGELVSITTDQTGIAFLIDETVVAQPAAQHQSGVPAGRGGRPLILEAAGTRELPVDGDSVVLHDVGRLDGRAVAVITSRSGGNPEATDERLMVVDVETAEVTDLGSVGGWEAGVQSAHLGNGVVSMISYTEASLSLTIRELDSTTRAVIEIGTDQHVAGSLVADEVIVARPAFTGSFDPVVVLERYSIEGRLSSTSEISVEGVNIDGGFCFTIEHDGDTLICDQTYGPPFRVAPDGVASLIPAPDRATVTIRRP